MQRKFLNKAHQKGMPVNQIDVVGIAKMDNAWATLDVEGGYVDWQNGRPRLITPGAALEPMPFDVRVNEGNIEFYATSDGSKTADMAYLNGQELLWDDEPTPTGITETGWVSFGTAPLSGNVTTVYFRLETVSPLVGGDLTSNTITRWVISTTGEAGTGTNKQRVIATVSNASDVYTVTQYLRGAQSINARYTDTESLALLTTANDLHKTQSIQTQGSNGSQSLSIFGFRDGVEISPVPAIEDATYRIMLWYPYGDEGAKKVGYITPVNFISSVVDFIDVNRSLDHESLDNRKILGVGDTAWHLGDEYIKLIDPNDPESGYIIDLDHADLSGLTADDHNDSTNGYVMLGGDGERNLMGEDTAIRFSNGAIIEDGAGFASVDPHNRTLTDSESGTSIDWNGRQLSTTGNVASLMWNETGVNVPDGKVYSHNDLQGVSGDGFSGGIKVSESSATAAAQTAAINATVFGGLL
jgi:hypothetical protein